MTPEQAFNLARSAAHREAVSGFGLLPSSPPGATQLALDAGLGTEAAPPAFPWMWVLGGTVLVGGALYLLFGGKE